MTEDRAIDLPTALHQWQAIAASLRAFYALGDVLQAAAEAETFIKAAPEQRAKLEQEIATLTAGRDRALTDARKAREEAARAAAERDEIKADAAEARRRMEASYPERVAQLEAEYREHDVQLQTAHDARKAELSAELQKIEHQVAEARQLRERLKAV